MKTILLAALLLFVPQAVLPRSARDDRDRVRREKIESILRLEDRRIPFGGGLAAYIPDDDPVICARAALACGSLQDTAAIGPLVVELANPDSATAEAAAFAIGQTGTRLSETGRRPLERVLIGKNLYGMPASGRLIEEIGKFGTASGLRDLLAFVADAHTARYDENLMMSLARFAIRGISNPDAVTFLLRQIRPGVPVPWQAVYALQRTGDKPETQKAIGDLAFLEHDRDPLVRMNLATLLGKLHATGGPLSLLERLAGMDRDWRVRVNAFKALGQLPMRGDGEIPETFRRGFLDSTVHVRIAALSAFPAPEAGLRDTTPAVLRTMRQLDSLAANVRGDIAWQIQAEAASALARVGGRIPSALLSGSEIRNRKLRARLLQAAGESGDSAAERLLETASFAENPQIVCAALEGLRSLAAKRPDNRRLADSAVSAGIRALAIHDMAIISTAAGILEDSLFRRSASIEPLRAALKALRPPDDTETMQDVLRALQKITGNDSGGSIAAAASPDTSNLDFDFLRSLPPVVTVKLRTSQGDVLIALDREHAPFTTMSILKLAKRGFYRGLPFHRVVANFVIQGGDPRGDGWGGPGYALRSEFSVEAFGTGTVGIASAGKDTEGSQFFITHSPQPHLDGRYTVVGRVIEGMNVVDRIQVDDRIYDIELVR
jgi:cyclophilin family peptidyl-prolyl cis-trans isomerase/HEAT repeat protein